VSSAEQPATDVEALLAQLDAADWLCTLGHLYVRGPGVARPLARVPVLPMDYEMPDYFAASFLWRPGMANNPERVKKVFAEEKFQVVRDLMANLGPLLPPCGFDQVKHLGRWHHINHRAFVESMTMEWIRREGKEVGGYFDLSPGALKSHYYQEYYQVMVNTTPYNRVPPEIRGRALGIPSREGTLNDIGAFNRVTEESRKSWDEYAILQEAKRAK